jgi:sirohydrochlorin ferrochelatase
MKGKQSETAVIVFAHGSRVEEGNRGVHDLARQIQEAGEFAYVRAAFLEIAKPDLAAAVDEAAAAGLQKVIVIPFFLTMGRHLSRDLPDLVASIQRRRPELQLKTAKALEGHPLIPSLVLARIREASENGSED